MLSTLLGSETRARILTLLLEDPERSFHVRELVRVVGKGSSGVQREIARLEEIGLVCSERSADGRRAIRLVETHPMREPLARLIAAEARAAYAPRPAMQLDELAARVNPRLRDILPRLIEACRHAHVERAVLFGSATELESEAAPRDVDIMVSLGGPVEGRAGRYFGLRRELERAGGLPVDLVEEDAVRNPYLRAEIDRTGVVIHEDA